MSKAKTPQIGDNDYDPSKDELFLDQVQPPPEATQMPAPLVVELGDKYKGTNKTADELAAAFGLEPDGTPRVAPAPDGPKCPTVSPDGYPFDTTAIPAGCGEPLTQECADYYNERYKPTTADAPPEFAKK